MTMTQATTRTGGPPSAPLAISTTGLTKRFGDRTVVDHIELEIPHGSVCGFVGPNGAGKTTTIRMLLGLVRPTAGSGEILGGSLEDPATYLDKVGALIESPAFYPQLSGRDNLKALARLGQLPVSKVDPALERSGLAARAGDRYRTYSLGMKQRLGIAAALLPSPELLVLDEPTNGLDPAGIVEMRALIRSFADDGITVLVSSHLISEIEQICDYVVMIRAGKLVHQGTVADLQAGQRPDSPGRRRARRRHAAAGEAAGRSGLHGHHPPRRSQPSKSRLRTLERGGPEPAWRQTTASPSASWPNAPAASSGRSSH